MNLYFESQLNYLMGILTIVSVYSHYYSFWSIFNYLNDDFYDQVFHQLIFSITEIIFTCITLKYSDKRRVLSRFCCQTMFTISLSHVYGSSFDQFISNVIKGEGALYQQSRDVLLFCSDILNVFISYIYARYIVFGYRDYFLMHSFALFFCSLCYLF